MVINSKLVIGYEILKIIPTQNWSYRTLYTAPNCTCDCKIEMLCSDSFGQTAPQSAMLKMTQICTANTPSYRYLNVFRNYLLIDFVGTVHPLWCNYCSKNLKLFLTVTLWYYSLLCRTIYFYYSLYYFEFTISFFSFFLFFFHFCMNCINWKQANPKRRKNVNPFALKSPSQSLVSF